MTKIPSADYSVLNRDIYNNVYEPAEDTFILLDALEEDIESIKSLKPNICLEIGSGSGVITTSLGKVLGNLYYLCTDINTFAVSATKAVSQSNGVPVEVICSNLVDAVKDRLMNLVDLLIFNPPYAVTPSDEVGSSNLFKATSGGIKGREVMDKMFPLVPKLLSMNGLFYLTCIHQNDVEDIAQCMDAYNLSTTKILERRCGIERLYVLRFAFKNLS